MSCEGFGLRRYSTEEYAQADMEDVRDALADGYKGQPRRNRLTNLEALFFRGFNYDPENGIYVQPQSRIRVAESVLHHMDLWKLAELVSKELDRRDLSKWHGEL